MAVSLLCCHSSAAHLVAVVPPPFCKHIDPTYYKVNSEMRHPPPPLPRQRWSDPRTPVGGPWCRSAPRSRLVSPPPPCRRVLPADVYARVPCPPRRDHRWIHSACRGRRAGWSPLTNPATWPQRLAGWTTLSTSPLSLPYPCAGDPLASAITSAALCAGQGTPVSRSARRRRRRRRWRR